MRLKIYHLFYFIFQCLPKISTKVVLFQFNQLISNDINQFDDKDIPKANDDDINYYKNLYNNRIYTIINIGNPNQQMMGLFNLDVNIFYISNQDYCYTTPLYNYSFAKSESSKIIKKIEGDEYFSDYYIINDTIKIDLIENNTKKEQEIQDIQFEFNYPKRQWGEEDKREKVYCADIGISLNTKRDQPSIFLYQLKQKKIINSYIITMNYTKNDGGQVYIGGFPHEYMPSLYKEEDLRTTYIVPRQSFSQFRIIMKNIYIKINETETISINNNEVYFHLELNVIVCPTNYFKKIQNLFFKPYFDSKICQIKNMTQKMTQYNMIICKNDKNFNIKSFPSIYFHHYELNYIFHLTYEELFQLKNDKFYFLIVHSDFSGSYWKLGKPFLKKYQITLNLDEKSINFYNITLNNHEGEVDTQDDSYIKGDLKSIILIIVCGVLGVGLVIVSYLFYKKVKGERKKRANELKDDEFEYKGIN